MSDEMTAPERKDDQPEGSKQASRGPSYLFLVLVTLVSLALDLGSKWWAKGRLEDIKTFADRRIEVIPGHFDLIFARNKGGAWGLLQNEPESIRRPFFIGVSILAIIFIVSLYRRITPEQRALKWGLPLVLGGALGNLVNRVQYNYVVDFIDMYFTKGGREYHWPTYNIADIAIVVGVGQMAIDMFTTRKVDKDKGAEATPASTKREADGDAASDEHKSAPLPGEAEPAEAGRSEAP